MTTPPKKPEPPKPDSSTEPEAFESLAEIRQGWVNRRRDKIIAEIERNRRGEYTVPTWALAAVLILLVGGWLALIIFG